MKRAEGSADLLVNSLRETLGRKIVDDAVAGACSMHGGSERCV